MFSKIHAWLIKLLTGGQTTNDDPILHMLAHGMAGILVSSSVSIFYLIFLKHPNLILVTAFEALIPLAINQLYMSLTPPRTLTIMIQHDLAAFIAALIFAIQLNFLHF